MTKKELLMKMGELRWSSEIQKPLVSETRLCSSSAAYSIIRADYYVDFGRNDKSSYLKNDSEWISVYTCDFYVIQIKDNTFNLIIIIFLIEIRK